MKITIRELKKSDSAGMLEWMTDPEIAACFRYDVSQITLASCQRFIKTVSDNPKNRHYAIANNRDEYLGTVSLKNIDFEQGTAEFAIGTRKSVNGIGAEATSLVLKEAFGKLNLKKVYLNVYSDNVRAQKCYLKVGFQLIREEKNALIKDGTSKDLKWYEITKAEYLNKHH